MFQKWFRNMKALLRRSLNVCTDLNLLVIEAVLAQAGCFSAARNLRCLNHSRFIAGCNFRVESRNWAQFQAGSNLLRIPLSVFTP